MVSCANGLHAIVTAFDTLRQQLQRAPRRWLVTGAAGFIGSHLVEELLRLGQAVVGLDNFLTGSRENLEQVLMRLPASSSGRLQFIEGDIRDPQACRQACEGAEIVLHQAALGSVPRSLADPATSHDVNVTGTLNLLLASRDAGVRRVVFASSSSVYGDEPALPKREDRIGSPLSPYAATKLFDEVYAQVFGRSFGLETIGLRYFNVFGPRQDPAGPYAAVIPLWFASLRKGEPAYINGDGSTSRDFCYVANAVQANLLAAAVTNPEAVGQVYNVAVGQRTTLMELYSAIRDEVARTAPAAAHQEPVHREFRPGDVRHSLADISKAARLLGYAPTHTLAQGLRTTAEHFARAAGGSSGEAVAR